MKNYDERPWGRYDIITEFKDDAGNDVVVKKIVVKPHQRLSYQSHKLRSEQWTFVQGVGLIILDGTELGVQKGSTVVVPIGAKHRVINTIDSDLVFIEIITGTYDEDDIVRIEDDYGRIQS